MFITTLQQSKTLRKYIFLFFLFAFGISFAYHIPFFNISLSNILYFKRLLYILLIPLFILAISWKRVKIGWFFYGCLLWGYSHFILYINSPEENTYIIRFGQLIFVYLFVMFFSQNNFSLSNKTRRNIEAFMFLFTTLICFLAFFNSNIAETIYNGFGGSRVFFSIWLSQIVFFILYNEVNLSGSATFNNKSNFFKSLALISPILFLQILSSGRIGLLVSIAIIFYYLRVVLSFNYFKIMTCAICIMLLTLLLDHYSPITQIHKETFITRGLNIPLEVISSSGNESISFSKTLFNYIDKVTSYRLSLDTNSIKAIIVNEKKDLISGVGVEKFSVLTDSSSSEEFRPHNIYLNHLGEVGLFGLISLVIIVLLPLIQKKSKYSNREKLLFWIILLWSFFIANLQPELLLTQVSSSVAYWFAYAKILKEKLSY